MKKQIYKKIISALLIISMVFAVAPNIFVTFAAEVSNLIEAASQNTSLQITSSQNIASEKTTSSVENNGTDYKEVDTKEITDRISKQKNRTEVEKLLKDKEKCSQLNDEEKSMLAEFYGVDIVNFKALSTIKDDLSYTVQMASIMRTLGYSIDDMTMLSKKIQEPKDILIMVGEVEAMIKQLKIGENDAAQIRLLVFEGVAAKDAYYSNLLTKALRISASDMKNNAALQSSIVQDYLKANFNKSEIRVLEQLAKIYKTDVYTLAKYCVDNDLSLYEMNEQINNENLISEVVMMSVMDNTPFNTPVADSYSPSTDLTAAAPYTYNQGVDENVNLVGGDFTYTSNELVVPGKNGQNLVLSIKYNSSDAILNDVVPYHNGYYEYQDVTYSTWVFDNYDANRWRTVYWYDVNVMDYVVYGTPINETYRYYNESEYSAALSYASTYPSYEEWTAYVGDPIYNYIDFYAYGGGGVTTNGHYAYTIVSELTWVETYTNELSATTYFESYNELGAGWSFGYDWIGGGYLHLGSGATYGIDITSTTGDSNLTGYTLQDIRLETYTAFTYNNRTSAYCLYFKNGSKEYFDAVGRLLAIVDRFGNQIGFQYTSATKMTPSKIVDTALGEYLFSFSNIDNGRKLTIDLPDDTTLEYNITSISGSDYKLESKKDRMGNTTSFSYSQSAASFNYFSSGASPVTNYYELLTGVSYATGGSTTYGYSQYSKTWGSGSQQYYRLTNRKEGTTYNQKTYGYTTVSSAGVATAISVTDGLGNRVDHTYDSTTKLPTQQSMYVDNVLKSNVTTTYNSNKLPLIVTKRVYEGSAYIETSEKYEYDSYGNLLNYWAPKDDVNNTRYASDSKFKIAYAYDTGDTGHYSIQTSKTYYLNDTTKIIEINELSTDNKHVVYSKVYENAIADANLKSKTQFIYATDAYGNMTEKRVFPDVINYPNDSIATVYSYANSNTAQLNSNYDGVFLTSQTVTGVKDADGNDIEAKPNYAAGVIDTLFIYNWIGCLISSKDAVGNTTTFTYDDLNRITLQTNQDATTVEYTYNMTQNTKTVRDEAQLSTLYDYDAYGNLVSVKNTADTFNIASYTYDNEFRRTEESSITTDGGSRTVYILDDLGRVTNKQTYNGSSVSLYQETYAYNDVFTLSSVQYNKVTKTVVGDTTTPLVITNTYTDKYGQLMKQSVMNGTNEYFDTFTYDYAGRKISQKAAIAYTYTSNPAYTTMWVYDYAGRVLEEYNKDGYFISNTYDSIGRLLTTTDYKGNEAATPYYVSYTYDILGRKLTETIPFTYYTDSNNNQVIAYAVNKYYYDRNGNVTKTLVKNNTPGAATDTYSKTATDYNSRGLATNVKGYEGTQLTSEAVYTYNARGSILTSTVGSSVTTYAYDDHGRLHTLTDARNEVETYTYNKNDLMTTSVDRNNLTTTYTYDGLGRNLTTTVTKNSITQVQATTYTASGQVATQTLTEGGTLTSSIGYLYNAMGQNTRVTDSVEKNYVYDIAGNRTSFDYAGNFMTYTYDEMGRLSTVSENDTLQVTYTYDINGNQQTITNNVTGIVTTNTYNLANMVSGIANMFGTLTRSKFTYAYRLDGNQIVKTDDVENTVTSYVYNDLGQLTSEAVLSGGNTTTTSYTYDNRGNRSTKTVGTAVTTYTYDLNNRLTTEELNTTPVTTTEYEYDDNGNQLLKTAGGTTTTSTYDGFNRLKTEGTTTYLYLPTGLRFGKRLSDSTKNVMHVWDGDLIVMDLYPNSNNTQTYVWGLNLLYLHKLSDDSKTYYLYNAHGDVVQLTSSTGAVIKTYHYDAFGVEVSPDSADANPIRYCGEYFDKETSTYYLRARYYDPTIGRFVSEDPIGSGLNWYTYCEGNPILYIDPMGTDVYYFYEPSQWTDVAFIDASYIYDYFGTTVHLLSVVSYDDFVSQWNEMGHEGVLMSREVNIDAVFIMTHGDGTSWSFGTGFDIDAVKRLQEKDIGVLVSLACNSGDPTPDTNMAQALMETQNIKKLIASDGIVSSGYQINNGVVNYDVFERHVQSFEARVEKGYKLYTKNDDGTLNVKVLIKPDINFTLDQLLRAGGVRSKSKSAIMRRRTGVQ